MTATPITITYLEITDLRDLRPSRRPLAALELTRVDPPDPELSRALYDAVGTRWAWRDRLSWDAARWRGHLARPGVETWVASVSGQRAGYFELERAGESVEIAYFGLLPAFIGQGLGGALLTHAIRRGFETGAARVWLHTCTLDHPQALANYLARGMKIYRTTTTSPGSSP